MRALVVFVLAVGCSDSATIEDGPCSSTQMCGDSAVCDFTAEGGPVCISRDGDLDNDGLTNEQDYCHHQPGGAFDEDRDGIGDDCDRCPIAAPRATPDTDNDMVDAPCDPAPSEDGDELLLFDGFQEGLDPRWTPTTPAVWSVTGGEMLVNLSSVGTQDFMKTAVVGKNAIAIEASFRIDGIEASDARHLVGIYANDPRPAGAAQAACFVTKADPTPTTELVVIETNSNAMNQMTTDAFNEQNLYRAGMYVTGGNARCVVLSNGNPLGTVQAPVTIDQLTEVALTAQATSVRFQYVLVVGH